MQLSKREVMKIILYLQFIGATTVIDFLQVLMIIQPAFLVSKEKFKGCLELRIQYFAHPGTNQIPSLLLVGMKLMYIFGIRQLKIVNHNISYSNLVKLWISLGKMIQCLLQQVEKPFIIGLQSLLSSLKKFGGHTNIKLKALNGILMLVCQLVLLKMIHSL